MTVKEDLDLLVLFFFIMHSSIIYLLKIRGKGMESCCLMGTDFVWDNETGSGDGRATRWMYLNATELWLKKTVGFTSCPFYHNKRFDLILKSGMPYNVKRRAERAARRRGRASLHGTRGRRMAGRLGKEQRGRAVCLDEGASRKRRREAAAERRSAESQAEPDG